MPRPLPRPPSRPSRRRAGLSTTAEPPSSAAGASTPRCVSSSPCWSRRRSTPPTWQCSRLPGGPRGWRPCTARATWPSSGLERAAEEARAAADRACALLVVPDGQGLDDAVAAASAAADAVREALPHEARLHRVRTQVADHEARLDDLAGRTTETGRTHAALPALLTRVHEALATADAAAARLSAQSALVDDLRTRLGAAREVPALTVALEAARVELVAAAVESQARREHWLDLREARIDGMAAELAGALAVGACCPVCGSAEHPHKAESRTGAPTSADESAALKALDDAKAAEHAHEQRVRELTGSLALLGERSDGLPVDDLEAQLLAASGELDRLAALAAEGERIRDQVTEAEARRRHLAAALVEQRAQRAELTAALRGLRSQEATLSAVVDAALADSGAPDLATLLEQHLARVAAGRDAARARREAAVAADEAELARRAWAVAAEEAGFADAGAAAAAQRGAAEVEALARRTAEHERRSDAVATVLDDGDLPALLAAPLPDVAALVAAHEQALDAVADAGAQAAVWSARARRLGGLVTELHGALAAWAPLRDELAVATGLASFAEGKAADNRLQMRLSAYVLAHRLGQVVAAANERLAGMSDQRYRLEHTGQPRRRRDPRRA